LEKGSFVFPNLGKINSRRIISKSPTLRAGFHPPSVFAKGYDVTGRQGFHLHLLRRDKTAGHEGCIRSVANVLFVFQKEMTARNDKKHVKKFQGLET